AVELLVGPAQQVVGVGVGPLVEGGDAAGEPRAVREQVMRCKPVGKALDAPGRRAAGGGAGVPEQQHELVPAVAEGAVALAEGAPEQAAELPEVVVASGVAEAVVELLEVV